QGSPVGSTLPITSVGFSPDGKLVVAGNAAGQVRWVELVSKKADSPALWHRGAISALAVSPDNRLIVSAGEDGKAHVWEAASGQPVGPPLMHRDRITGAVFSPDGKWLLTGGADRDRTARLWELVLPPPPPAAVPFKGKPFALALSPDGKAA